MPIDIDRFEGAPKRELRAGGPTNAEVILGFLAANPEQAFTPKEIHERTDVARGSIGVVLSRLEEHDLVRHRGEYWAIIDDHERARTVLRERGTDDIIARLAAPDRDGRPDVDPRSKESSGTSVPSGSHRAAASAFVDRVRDQFSDVIDACYVFGSVARGTESATSDVDVLVVIANEADFQAIDEQLLDIAFDVQLEHDIRIEVHSMPASEFERRRERGEPFVRRVVTEGVRSG